MEVQNRQGRRLCGPVEDGRLVEVDRVLVDAHPVARITSARVGDASLEQPPPGAPTLRASAMRSSICCASARSRRFQTAMRGAAGRENGWGARESRSRTSSSYRAFRRRSRSSPWIRKGSRAVPCTAGRSSVGLGDRVDDGVRASAALFIRVCGSEEIEVTMRARESRCRWNGRSCCPAAMCGAVAIAGRGGVTANAGVPDAMLVCASAGTRR